MGIRNNLLNIRLSKGYKFQGEFAAFLEMDIKDYNRIENNRKQVSLETAMKIAQKLNMKIEEIWHFE